MCEAGNDIFENPICNYILMKYVPWTRHGPLARSVPYSWPLRGHGADGGIAAGRAWSIRFPRGDRAWETDAESRLSVAEIRSGYLHGNPRSE